MARIRSVCTAIRARARANRSGRARRGGVRRVAVDLGVANAGLIQIRGNLQAGDQVVIRGNERLFDGQQVSYREADLNPPDVVVQQAGGE